MRRSTTFRKRQQKTKSPNAIKAASQHDAGTNPGKNEFINNISHEIRTPMNAIMGFAQMLQRTNLTPQQTDYVDVILDSGKKLLLIINNLLDLSNLQMGKTMLNPISCQPTEAVGKLWEHYRPQIQAKGITPFLDCASDIPELVFDCEKLERVLGYLLSNAIKYTNQGFISLKMSMKKGKDDKYSLFSEVADSGIGIPADLLPHIFEEFEQADNSVTRRYEGLGIGLSLARKTIALMGGDIWCHSIPEQGSQFFVEIPVEMSSREQ